MFPATIFFDLGDTLAFRDPAGVLRRATDARDALQVLRDRGYRIGLLSNQAATATVAAVVAELAGIGLGADLVEPALVTISSEIPGNVGKPARPVFDLALSKARHTAPSTQAIFVTEDAGHCAAATSFGWRAIQVGSGVSLGGLLALLPPAAPAASLVGTNFDLAPRPKLVGGSWAVPIDISRITGQLRFDGAASAATGDATLEFRLGKHSGCPVFDLRQPVTGVWLDGTPLLPSAVAHRDADGGPDAKVRVLDQMLDAGSTHTLRLTYDIGPPDAPMTGSYLPQVAWSAGPRLTFNFGFTDLGPGRYLESFLPANLIFDQYTVDLDVQITGTAVPHLPITNGALTTLGANHWRVVFGPRTTALSTLFELRAANTLTAATHAASLPVSGGSVAVTAWKLQTNGADVAAQAASIGGMLAANETAIGRYQHGDRFTAFINTGGMEYDGGTTSGVGPLRHEVFHSWWGRGLRPANQVDGWLDEAWTSYQDGGGTAVTPLDFTEAPVTLASRNAWSRITPAAAYTSGERLFRGLAALLGAASLRSAMNAFWQKHLDRPVTTEMLETFLLARTGRPEIVEAFHRFVYGFADPSPVPDLWLSDDPAHTGAEAWSGRFWDSPDLWVRNRDDGGLTHQNPEFGQDNWLHARVRNRSTAAIARHYAVTFGVKNFAGTQFTYPIDFIPSVTAACGFGLGPGETHILKARWPAPAVPPPGTHPCLVAALFARLDRPAAGKRVWEQNNLAQKNLTVVDLRPGDRFLLPILLANLLPIRSITTRLELIRPAMWPALEARLVERLVPVGPVSPVGDESALECGHGLNHGAPDAEDAPDAGGALGPLFGPGPRAGLPVHLGPSESRQVGLSFTVPADAAPNSSVVVDAVQRDGNRIVGGVALRIIIR